MSSQELRRVLGLYLDLPPSDPFRQLLATHQQSLFIRAIHESNRIEDEGPETEEGTRRLGSELAFHILEFFRTELHDTESSLVIPEHDWQEIEDMVKDPVSLRLGFMETLIQRLEKHLSQHALTLNQAEPIARHTFAFMLGVLGARSGSITIRAANARYSMRGEEIPPAFLTRFGTWDQAILVHHALLMEPFPDALPGQWKNQDNHLPQSQLITYSAKDTPVMMCKWGAELDRALIDCMLGRRDAIEVAAWASYSLLAIHPFQDGNGRLSRLLMNLILIGFADMPFPILLAQGGEAKAVQRYRKALRKIDASHLSLLQSSPQERQRALAPLMRLIESSILDTLKQIDTQARDLHPDYQPLFES